MEPDNSGNKGMSDEDLGKLVKQGWVFLKDKVSRRQVLTAVGPVIGGVAGYFGGSAQAETADPFAVAVGHDYVIESVHYMCHLQQGSPGPSGKWGESGSTLLSRIHITYTYRANQNLEETEEWFQTQAMGATLRSFFSTIAVAGQSEPPSPTQVSVKLAFPLKKGAVKTYATGVDIEYPLPLTPTREMNTVDVGEHQYFIHYPNKSDYIKHATMTIESTTLNLTGGQFSTRKEGQGTQTTPILAQSPCQDACGTGVWHPVVTASVDDILPGADFGLRISWM